MSLPCDGSELVFADEALTANADVSSMIAGGPTRPHRWAARS
jgi:hypothetical protein